VFVSILLFGDLINPNQIAISYQQILLTESDVEFWRKKLLRVGLVMGLAVHSQAHARSSKNT